MAARTESARRRRAFLHALAAGRSVGESAEHAGIPWSTLYAWRRKSKAFANAWDEAAEFALGSLTDRLETALVQRAVEGTDEPVFHAGKLVGTRKRYSDALLLAGLRQLTGAYYPTAPKGYTLPDPDEPVRPRVIIQPLKGDGATRTPATAPQQQPAEEIRATAPVAPPEPAASGRAAPEMPASAKAAPPPQPEPALRWDHLGRG